MCALFTKKEGVVIKRLVCLILALLMLSAFLCSCRNSGEAFISGDNSSRKISVVTTIFPYYDFTRHLAGDKANVKLLIPPGSEPHDYEPSPKDILSINEADIFIYNGGESDVWVENILSSLDRDVKIMKMFDYIEPLYEQDIDHNQGDEYDEHIWTSPKNALIMSGAISREIISSDSANEKYYKNRTKSYISQLSELDNAFRNVSGAEEYSLASADRTAQNTLVFADRFPLLYLAAEYGFNYVSAFPGCTSETQPSVKTVIKLIDFVNLNNIPVVFHLDNSNENLAGLISEDTGARVMPFYSCHNVTKSQYENGETYISLMELNLKSIREAFS